MTKGDLVSQALSYLGLSTSLYDIPNETSISIVQSLDNMMSSWEAGGIKLSYTLSSGDTSPTLSARCEVPDWAKQSVILSLAIQIAPMFGKTVQPELMASARTSYQSMARLAKKPLENQSSLVRLFPGAGNRHVGTRPHVTNDFENEGIVNSNSPSNVTFT